MPSRAVQRNKYASEMPEPDPSGRIVTGYFHLGYKGLCGNQPGPVRPAGGAGRRFAICTRGMQHA
jgi:hypothetical protein